MLILRFNQKLFSGFDDYYRKNRNQIQENNYNDLVNGSQDNNVKKRAKNLYKDNYNLQKKFTEDAFIEAALNGIHNQETFAVLIFAKSDKKQDSAEECQAEFIRSNYKNLLKEIKILPKSGKGSLYVSNGKISSSKGSTITKTLDLEMTYEFNGKTLKFYGTLKHIDNQGGAQKNQFTDLLLTNQEFSKISDPNIITLTIVSGTYFKPLKMKELNSFSSKTNYSVNIDSLGNILKKCILEWLKREFPDDKTEYERVKNYA